MKSKQAKDFLVQQTAEQAALENVPLSDIEKEMMYFTESDAASCDNPIELNDRFEAQYDTPTYERKMWQLLHHAYDRLKAEDPSKKRNWDEAIRTLRRGDHYLLVLWDTTPRGERPKGDVLKLVGTALFIVAALTLTGFWAAKHNIDLDRYSKYSVAIVLILVLVASGTLRLVYRLAFALFHRKNQDDKSS